MELRDHPLMTRKSGMKNWPPHWSALTRDKSQWPTGEVGILQQAWMHGQLDNCLFLFIEHQGGFFTGSMYFDDAGFCDQLHRLMKTKLGRSIKEIGDLDLSHTLWTLRTGRPLSFRPIKRSCKSERPWIKLRSRYMELRNHPIMVCDGVRQWPPKWMQTHGPGATSASGEMGVLEAVFLSQVTINKVYLLMHTQEGNVYLGTMLFEKAKCAKAVFDLLQTCINKTLRAIGSMDFPSSLR